MHMDKKSRVLEEIESVKSEIESLASLREFSQAHSNHSLAENLKATISGIDTKVKEIRYEEIHLNTGYDQKLDIDISAAKFNYYALFWRFASEWKYKKELWLGKSVINNAVTVADLRDIEATLESGNIMIR